MPCAVHIVNLAAQVDCALKASDQLSRSTEAEVAALKASLRGLQREAAEKARVLARKAKELDDLKGSFSEQLTAAEQKAAEEVQQLRRRVAEVDQFCRDLEAVGLAGDLNTQLLVDQLKEKYVSAVSQLEKKLQAECENAKAESTRHRCAEHLQFSKSTGRANQKHLQEFGTDGQRLDREQEFSRSLCGGHACCSEVAG